MHLRNLLLYLIVNLFSVTVYQQIIERARFLLTVAPSRQKESSAHFLRRYVLICAIFKHTVYSSATTIRPSISCEDMDMDDIVPSVDLPSAPKRSATCTCKYVVL